MCVNLRKGQGVDMFPLTENKVDLVDMFPRTEHVETVVLMSRVNTLDK